MLKKILKIILVSFSLLVLNAFAQDEPIEHFDEPRILEAKTIIFEKEDGFGMRTTIYVNVDLNLETVKQHIGKNTFPIVTHRSNDTDIFGYRLDSIEAEGIDSSKEYERYAYTIKGIICKDPTCLESRLLNSGDSLSFNVKTEDMEGFNDIGFGLESEDLYIKSKDDIPAAKLAWARNATAIPTMNGDPPPRPDFEICTNNLQFTGIGNICIQVFEKDLQFDNLPLNAKVQVYNARGQKRGTTRLANGLYLVKVNSYIFKIPVK